MPDYRFLNVMAVSGDDENTRGPLMMFCHHNVVGLLEDDHRGLSSTPAQQDDNQEVSRRKATMIISLETNKDHPQHKNKASRQPNENNHQSSGGRAARRLKCSMGFLSSTPADCIPRTLTTGELVQKHAMSINSSFRLSSTEYHNTRRLRNILIIDEVMAILQEEEEDCDRTY